MTLSSSDKKFHYFVLCKTQAFDCPLLQKSYDWTDTVRGVHGHQLGHGKWGRTGWEMSHSIICMLLAGLDDCMESLRAAQNQCLLVDAQQTAAAE